MCPALPLFALYSLKQDLLPNLELATLVLSEVQDPPVFASYGTSVIDVQGHAWLFCMSVGEPSSDPHDCPVSTLNESFKRNLYKAKEKTTFAAPCKVCRFSWSLERCWWSWHATSQTTGLASLDRVGSEIIVLGQVEGSLAGDSS